MSTRKLMALTAVGPSVGFIAAAALAAALLGGCATLKADLKAAEHAVAEKCGPQLLADALVIVPLTAALADCEYRHEDCTPQRTQLDAAASAEAQACAAAVLHVQAVSLVAVDGGQ